jgi:hypothetical protein
MVLKEIRKHAGEKGVQPPCMGRDDMHTMRTTEIAFCSILLAGFQ